MHDYFFSGNIKNMDSLQSSLTSNGSEAESFMAKRMAIAASRTSTGSVPSSPSKVPLIFTASY